MKGFDVGQKVFISWVNTHAHDYGFRVGMETTCGSECAFDGGWDCQEIGGGDIPSPLWGYWLHPIEYMRPIEDPDTIEDDIIAINELVKEF